MGTFLFVTVKTNLGVILQMGFDAKVSMLSRIKYHHWNQRIFLRLNGYFFIFYGEKKIGGHITNAF